MTPAQLQTIEEIFHAALDQGPDQVARFLETTCEGDELLRGEVEALLALRQRVGSFIETPAVGIATRIIRNGQADLLVGQTFGHYKISKRIGSGGMGEVYLATDMIAGRKAALKLLPIRFTGDAERLKRFQQEAHAVVALNHPNILTVYEIGEEHSTHYIASELIEGETLRQRLLRGRMELSEAVDVAIQVASALAAAHEAGIVHRDINPENIMLRPDGYVKVLDFGIAKLAEQEVPLTIPRDEALLLVETNLGLILGTVPYMSPEQACGAPVDKRTDIWSLGVVLYEMVTGHAPFIRDTPREVMSTIVKKKPPPLTSYIRQTPRELQQMISKALRKDRTERYQSASEMLPALKNLRHKLELKAVPSWLRWARSPVALVLALLVFALALALPFYRHRNMATSLPPKKSIAVLPLENLSEEKENAFFADGIHDELLSNLSKIADLKVISRTSVMQYKSGIKRNLKQTAQQLGVSNVVEGNVRRAGNRVRVSVQLIDARTDTHLWAEHYDRDVADVFAIQAEIAQEIADTLEVKLSPSQSDALAEAPTRDTEAYDLFLKGEYEQHQGVRAPQSAMSGESFDRAQIFYRQALARDPNFALAYARLAWSELHRHWFISNLTSAELAEVRSNIDRALAIAPALPDAHLALGVFHYWGHRDYDSALRALDRAIELQPSNSDSRTCRAAIYRRRGEWRRALAESERALELNPRDPLIPAEIGNTYNILRRWSEAEQSLKRALAIDPHFGDAARFLAWTYVNSTGDIPRARKVYEGLQEERAINVNSSTGNIADLIGHGVYLDVIDRHFADALKAWDVPLAKTPEARLRQLEARVGIQVLAGQGAVGKLECEQTRALLEARLAERPQDRNSLIALAWAYVCLGRNADALRVAQQAVDSLPVEKDALSGPQLLAALAEIEARTGRPEEAVKILRQLLTAPAGGAISIARLKIDPVWDPIRDNPGFQKLLSEPEPATVYK
jgi:eukaryotic-like serine/threonine-protein kinase